MMRIDTLGLGIESVSAAAVVVVVVVFGYLRHGCWMWMLLDRRFVEMPL